MELRYSESLACGSDIYSLYERLGWNEILKMSREQLLKAMEQSWRTFYAYDGERLVGCGRIISDGIITAVLCGLGWIRTTGTGASERKYAEGSLSAAKTAAFMCSFFARKA